ncbi:MAG: T9SS type A sorting domain-containing protein [Saprospiraceae bacterium]
MRTIFTFTFLLLFQTTNLLSQCWDQVSIGRNHTVAIHSDGTIWSWGNNQYGQLGDGTSVSRNIPGRVNNEKDWKQISAGEDYSLAIKIDGSLWVWGRNEYGVLGDGTNISRNSPKRIGTDSDWKQVSAAKYQSGAIKIDGTVWVWGNNTYGQLGEGQGINHSLPNKLMNFSQCKQISAGYLFYTFLKDDGSLWSQGVNSYGQLGDGTYIDSTKPVRVGSSNAWSFISCGGFHNLALQQDSTLWAWGRGEDGRLGLGSLLNQPEPKKLGTSKDWKQVAAGYDHSMAIKYAGTLWGWGSNYSGQLGLGSNVRKDIPTRVIAGSEWDYVDAGELRVSVGLKKDGTCWLWGDNSAGQLGDGTNIDKNFPARIMCTEVNSDTTIWFKQNLSLPIESRGMDAKIVNENVVWFYAEGGTFLPSWEKSFLNYSFARTVNGGQQWQTGIFPFNGKLGELSNMAAVDDSTAWVAYIESLDAEFGSISSKIYKTTNGGQNWELANISLGSNWVNNIHFFNKNDGFIIADATSTDFNIYTTSNEGATWTKVNDAMIPDLISGDEYGVNTYTTRGDKIWFPTWAGRIFYSPDKGKTWEVINGPADMIGLILQIAVDDIGNIYIDDIDLENDKHRFFRRNASDGNWINLTPSNDKGFIFFSCVPETNTIIMVDSKDKNTRISSNFGQSWMVIDSINADSKYFVKFLNSKTGFCSNVNVGIETNSILKYVGSPLSGLLSLHDLNIDLIVYPNPSVELITIKFDIVKKDHFWIMIHDVTGNLMFKKSINEVGLYTEEVDVKSLIAGTYFLTISNQEGLKSRSFLKL